MRYTDTQLVEVVSSNLTSYQEILIENAASGRAEEQDIIPSLTLTFAEIRKLTHRTRIRNALITKLIGWLEDEGLEVEWEDEQLVITKPAEDLDTEFDSLKDLIKAVKTHGSDQVTPQVA